LMPVSQVQWLKTREGVEMHAEMIEHAITCNMPSSGKHYELIEIIPLLWCYRSGCTPHPCISSIPSILCKSMEVLTLPWYSQCGLPVAPCFGILVNAHNTVGYPASTELSMSPANKCDLWDQLKVVQCFNDGYTLYSGDFIIPRAEVPSFTNNLRSQSCSLSTHLTHFFLPSVCEAAGWELIFL
jgi:hypothetical protein